MIEQIDIVARLLQVNDPTTAQDFAEVNSPRHALHGENRLLLAILETALENVRGTPSPGLGHKRALEVRQDDIEWIQSEESEYIFSFVVVCELLGFDAQAVRAAIITPELAALAKIPREPRAPRVFQRHAGRPKNYSRP
jgi:hypothetical protein